MNHRCNILKKHYPPKKSCPPKSVWLLKIGCLLTASLVFSTGGISNLMARADETTERNKNQIESQTENQTENQTESQTEDQTALYGIGSTSKVVVTAAVMKLSEEGKIDLDVPLTTYIPEFEMSDPRYRDITTRMLLDHSSGIQGGTLTNAMLLGDADTFNHDTLLTSLKGQRLKADPGAFAAYCNDGFTLAEILVERVSGLSFTDYIEQKFALPLGLTTFKTPQSRGMEARLATIYDEQTGTPLPPEMANVIGSGGIYATAEELCRFSQIFMRSQGNAAGILSEASAKEMEYSSYAEKINPDQYDSSLSYGLSWDSVDTYPFNRYGIKAVVKGGDTSFYHSSLVVLPEENISCAVLTSGGSSLMNQLAVQEILLTYLDEIERIERGEEEPQAEEKTLSMPAELLDYGGWYAGNDLWQLSLSADGTLTLTDMESGHRRSQTYEYHEDGGFYSVNGDYINPFGELARGSNGRIGSSSLRFVKAADGEPYLMASTYETCPRLGTTANYLPIAEKITPKAAASKVAEAWSRIDGKEYYLTSEKYTSAVYLTHFMVKAEIVTEPGGYLTFKDNPLNMAELTDTASARFFGTVPGQVGRDLADYYIVEKDGKSYLETGSYRYLSEDGLQPFPAENETITINAEGEAMWFFSGEEQKNRKLTIETSAGGAWYIYDHTGKTMDCVRNSWLSENETSFFLPKSGRVAFVGEEGTQFQIRYAP